MFAPQSTLRAGGLIQRSPEVGEYVVYDLLAIPIQEDEGADLSEIQGTLRVACVGFEQDGDAISRWIEADMTLTEDGSPQAHFVFKLLVPDAGVDDPEALLPMTRGWVRMLDTEDASEVAPERIALHQPTFLFMRTVLASAEELEEASLEKTIEVNGESIVLSTAATGPFETLSQQIEQTATMTLTGEGTWWPHDDFTFVPAADLIWTMTLGEDETPIEDRAMKGIALQLIAVEIGDDAVSALPDSN